MTAKEYEKRIYKLEELGLKFEEALYTYRVTFDPFWYFVAMIFDNMIDEVNNELEKC